MSKRKNSANWKEIKKLVKESKKDRIQTGQGFLTKEYCKHVVSYTLIATS